MSCPDHIKPLTEHQLIKTINFHQAMISHAVKTVIEFNTSPAWQTDQAQRAIHRLRQQVKDWERRTEAFIDQLDYLHNKNTWQQKGNHVH